MCCKRLFQVCTVRADFAGAVEHKHSHICLSDVADGQGTVGNGLSFAGNSVHISAVGQVAPPEMATQARLSTPFAV